MSSTPRLIVGLGNPGTEYDATRHNVGFMAVDAIADHYKCPSWKKKFKGLVTSSGSPDLLFLKPQTYMNLSGEAVAEALHFHKFAPADVIVFHDDLDLLPGQVRIKQGGGAGGHNGLKSIDAHIGKDYWRVRIGIGRPGAVAVATAEAGAEQSRPIKGDVTNYVLGGFAKADRVWLEPLLAALAGEFDKMLDGKTNDYQNRATQKAAAN